MVKSKVKKELSWDEIGKAIGAKMEKGCDFEEKNWFNRGCSKAKDTCGPFYGLGLLGALVYFITTATSLTGIIVGVIKAIFWPGVIVYGILKFLGM